jgi:hypothetical protein
VSVGVVPDLYRRTRRTPVRALGLTPAPPRIRASAFTRPTLAFVISTPRTGRSESTESTCRRRPRRAFPSAHKRVRGRAPIRRSRSPGLRRQTLELARRLASPGFGEERAWAISRAGAHSSPNRAPSACSLPANTGSRRGLPRPRVRARTGRNHGRPRRSRVAALPLKQKREALSRSNRAA